MMLQIHGLEARLVQGWTVAYADQALSPPHVRGVDQAYFMIPTDNPSH